MNHHSSNRSAWMRNWLPVTAAGIVIVGSIGLMTGWSPQPTTEIFANPVFLPASRLYLLIGILFAGLSLALQIFPSAYSSASANRLLRLGARLFAALTFLLGVVSLLDAIPELHGVTRSWLHNVFPQSLNSTAETMSMLSSVCAILAGWGLFRLDRPTRRMRYPTEYCALIIIGLMGIPIISYLFGVQVLAHILPSPAISLVAPPAFVLLAVGMLFSRPKHPLMTVFLSPAPGGKLLRTVLPAALVLLISLSLFAEWGAIQGFYSPEMISPLAVLVGGAMLFFLFWRAAHLLNQEYGIRIRGEAELAKTNDLIRIVSDFTTDAICVKDRKGRYIYLNPMGQKVLAKPLEAALGRTSAEVMSDQHVIQAVEANNQKVLDEGKASVFELPLDTDAGVRTYHVTTAPWFGTCGDVLGTVSIATDITDRKLAEDALRAQEARLEKLVEARTKEVRELIGHLETMREEEKRAIARELHDDMGASLTALNMHLAILFQQISADPGMADRIAQIKALLGSITATKRRIQNGLRPDKLDIFGIKTAISDLAQDFENYTGISCSVSLPDEEVKYSTQVETSLFRMVQEALNNIAKHAKASQVDIILDDDGENIYLTIRDNGIGITSESRPEGLTHGLRGMRERAAYLGGGVVIDSKPGGGTRIGISLPRTHTAPPLTTTNTLALDSSKHAA